jgi:MFS family permease
MSSEILLAEPNEQSQQETVDLDTHEDESTHYANMEQDEPLLSQAPPSDAKTRERALYAKTIALVFMTCVDLVSFSAIQSFLPMLLRERFPSMTPGQIGSSAGAIIGVFFAARCVSTVIFGTLSDTYGRKWFLVFSLGVSVVCTAVFALGNAVWLLILIRFIQGFFSATLEVAKAGIVDVTTNDWLPSNTRSMIFSYVVAIITAVRATATGLGGVVVGAAVAAGLATNGFNFTCAFAGVIVAIGFLVSLFMPETKTPAKSEHLKETLLGEPKRSPTDQLWFVLHDRVRFTLVFTFFLGSFSNSASNVAWILITQELTKYGGLEFTPLLTGVIFLIYGLFCFIFQITLFKRFMTYFGLMATYRIGGFAQIIQCVLMAIIVYTNALMVNFTAGERNAAVWTLLVLFTIVVAIGFTCISVAQTMIVNVTLDMKAPGIVQGVIGSADTLGRALGPIIIGLIYSL